MTGFILSRLALVATLIAIFSAQAAAQATTQAAPKRVIVVSLEDHKLALIQDGQIVKVYSVAVGKPSTPSPAGTFTIARRVANPTYFHGGKVIPPGPDNPVGTRWMGLSIRGYGIHGTNEPHSIGKAASHGCIRMARADLEELFPIVGVGDTVELVAERNAETAQIFGESHQLVPAAAPQPLLTAQTVPELLVPTTSPVLTDPAAQTNALAIETMSAAMR